MKTLLAALIVAWLLVVTADAKAINFDPAIAGQTTLTVSCVDAVQREDGTPLAIGEIALRRFYVETNGIGGFVDTKADNTISCSQVFDMTKVPDGSYIYAVTTVDIDGRESVLSPTRVTATVKRLANPNSPSTVTGTRS